MTKEEKEIYNALKDDFDKLDATVGKTIFYMREFLGISFNEISEILHYTIMTVRVRYAETKRILGC